MSPSNPYSKSLMVALGRVFGFAFNVSIASTRAGWHRRESATQV
jgi:hypothetical protein